MSSSACVFESFMDASSAYFLRDPDFVATHSERTGPECGPPLAGAQPPPKMAPPPQAVPPPQMAPPPQVAPPPPNKYFEEGSSGEAL